MPMSIVWYQSDTIAQRDDYDHEEDFGETCT